MLLVDDNDRDDEYLEEIFEGMDEYEREALLDEVFTPEFSAKLDRLCQEARNRYE